MSGVWHRRQSSDSESHCNAVRLFNFYFFSVLRSVLPSEFRFKAHDQNRRLFPTSCQAIVANVANFPWIGPESSPLHRISLPEILKHFRFVGWMFRELCKNPIAHMAFWFRVDVFRPHLHSSCTHFCYCAFFVFRCLSATNLNGVCRPDGQLDKTSKLTHTNAIAKCTHSLLIIRICVENGNRKSLITH